MRTCLSHCPLLSQFRRLLIMLSSAPHLACCYSYPQVIMLTLHSRYIQNPAEVSHAVTAGTLISMAIIFLLWYSQALLYDKDTIWEMHHWEILSWVFHLHSPRQYRSITQCILIQSRDVLNTRWMRLWYMLGLFYSKLFIQMHPCV